jgi:translation initiation factor 4G
MSSGGSQRGGNREDYPQADGRTVNTTRTSTRAGDLSQFGRISKLTTFGPASVFAGKKEIKRESISRTCSNSNMFSMLESAAQDKGYLLFIRCFKWARQLTLHL